MTKQSMTRRPLNIGFLGLAMIACRLSLAQNPEDLRRAFMDIRDDKIPHNCEHAAAWLSKYREQLKDDLVAELYKTDAQGRDVILDVLCDTKSFVPDERFLRFLMARLPQKDTFLSNDKENWKYINGHFDQFDRLLKDQIAKMDGKPNDLYVVWAIAWLAKKRGILEEYAPLYTSNILAKVAINLKNDQKDFNAGQAVRLFLLLGDQSLPSLREATKSSDKQCRSLANATIDALGGKRQAFGYLNSKVYLTITPFGPTVTEPDWLPDATQPYLERETYP
jgi:hypothetical protein